MEKAKKQELMKEYGRAEGDVGSPEVQVAVLTGRIAEITEHLKEHRKDHSSRRGLIAMVNRRRKLLNYLSLQDRKGYMELIQRLQLRR